MNPNQKITYAVGATIGAVIIGGLVTAANFSGITNTIAPYLTVGLIAGAILYMLKLN